MARGIPKDPQKRQAQIERGKRLAELKKELIKKNGSQRTTPTFKEGQFAKAYVKHKGNGSKAALEVYNTNKRNSKTLAYELLQKPIVQKEIKQQLDDAGLSLDDLSKYTSTLITKNMEGKASQAVAASMVQFAFKLHNALPASKKMNMNLTVTDQLPGKDVDGLKKMMEELQKTNQALLSVIEGKS